MPARQLASEVALRQILTVEAFRELAAKLAVCPLAVSLFSGLIVCAVLNGPVDVSATNVGAASSGNGLPPVLQFAPSKVLSVAEVEAAICLATGEERLLIW